jgi:serine/threonine protein kinase
LAWFSKQRGHPAPAALAPGQAAAAVDGRPLLAGRYRLGARIGSGGAAVVHEAVDLRTGSIVAVKLITLADDLLPAERADWLARLRREADIGRRLQHPDIVAAQDAGLDGPQAWLVMDRVQGTDLSRYTQPSRLLPEAVVMRIGARVGAALAHAHVNGVVHRDLKPGNVLINLGTGQIKLADFGAARPNDSTVTRTGVTLGTPSYMAPELLAGAEASPASDAYALGVMLFELLAGRRPHQADTLGELLAATARLRPASLALLRPDLPAPVVLAVDALLAGDPGRRPADLMIWSNDAAALAALMSRVVAPSASTRL